MHRRRKSLWHRHIPNALTTRRITRRSYASRSNTTRQPGDTGRGRQRCTRGGGRGACPGRGRDQHRRGDVQDRGRPRRNRSHERHRRARGGRGNRAERAPGETSDRIGGALRGVPRFFGGHRPHVPGGGSARAARMLKRQSHHGRARDGHRCREVLPGQHPRRGRCDQGLLGGVPRSAFRSHRGRFPITSARVPAYARNRGMRGLLDGAPRAG